MIVVRSPLRISFFGGGTDYPAYYNEHGGAALSTTIDKYVYVTVNRLTEFFEHRVGVYYSRVERVASLDEIQHPAVRECLRHLEFHRGLEVHIAADLPARSGLGSSSSFTVGLLQALHGVRGHLRSKRQLAEEAVFVEQQLIGERVGSQDQFASAFGGLNLMRFARNGVEVTPVVAAPARLAELRSSFMLFFTGIQRYAHEVLEQQHQRTTSGQNSERLRKIREMVDRGVEVLSNGCDLARFGELLHEGWMEKRGCSDNVSNPQIDAWYEAARSAGALGGKLLGAGGGGFILLCVPPERQYAVRERLRPLQLVKFDFDRLGSNVIFYQPEAL